MRIYLVEIGVFITATSSSSVAVGTGNKTFVLATDINFRPTNIPMTVTADDGSGNTMTGTVVSYDAATQTLIVNVASTGGSGTHSTWTISGTTTLRYSTSRGFITKPSETPANAVFLPRVNNPGNFEQYIYRNGTTYGRSEVGYGVVILNNGDSSLDALLQYGFDGRILTIRRGEDTGDYPGDFITVFSGTMQQAEFGWSDITLRLRDRQAEVANKPIQTVRFAGTNSLPNGVEGVATDLKGKPKPLLYGKVENISPPLVNTSKLTYQISEKQINSIQAVRDQGVAISAGSSHASLTLLQAATPGAGTYDYYLGSGSDGAYFRLGSSPAGQITCDATQGANAAARTVAQLVNTILQEPGDVDSGDIDSTSVTALDSANNAVVGVWIGTEDRTVGDVIDDLCASIGAFWSITRDGDFTVGRLELAGGSPDDTLEEWKIIDDGNGAVQRISTNDAANGLPINQLNLAYRKNYTPQDGGNLAGAVSIVDRNFYKEAYRNVTAADSAVLTKHPLSEQLIVTTLLTDATDAQDEADRLLVLYKTRRDYLQVVVDSGYTGGLNLNDVVEMDVERFDWAAGKSFRVLGITEDFATEKTTLSLWG